MNLDKYRFGEFGPTGAIKKDVQVSILSGATTRPGDPLIPIPDTNKFYRVTAGEKRRKLTWEQRQEIAAFHGVTLPSEDEARQRVEEAALREDEDFTEEITPVVELSNRAWSALIPSSQEESPHQEFDGAEFGDENANG